MENTLSLDAERSKHLTKFEVLHTSNDRSGPAVLILGGSTFMGRELVETLLSQGARVCIVNRGRKYWGTDDPSGGRVARVVADRRDVQEFAARLDVATRRLGQSWDLIADFSAYTGNDIRAALTGLRGRFKTYVFISSDSIYEVSSWSSQNWKCRTDQSEQIVSESFGVRPEDVAERRRLRKADSYGDGKLEAEEALAQGLSEECAASSCSISLRLPDVIGPFDDTLRLWAYWHWLHTSPDEGPQVRDLHKSKRPRHIDAIAEDDQSIPLDPLLAFVFSRDVARFIARRVGSKLPESAPRCDALNLGCLQQCTLGDMLHTFASSAGLKQPLVLAQTPRPRTFLPSVDRPWPLDLRRMREVYNFEPTPLEDVLKICAAWFAGGCSQFPKEASRAARKLPKGASAIAIERAGLQAGGSESSSSSDSESSSN